MFRWLVLVVVLVLIGCTTPAVPDPPGSTAGDTGCADVIGVEIDRDSDGLYTFDVTVRSDDRGWDKYADGWTVTGPDGTVLGERILTHPHENEQPFTRSLSGVSVPSGPVTVAARDSVVGFCGATVTVEIP